MGAAIFNMLLACPLDTWALLAAVWVAVEAFPPSSRDRRSRPPARVPPLRVTVCCSSTAALVRETKVPEALSFSMAGRTALSTSSTCFSVTPRPAALAMLWRVFSSNRPRMESILFTLLSKIA